MFSSRASAQFLHEMLWKNGTADAINDRITLTALKYVWIEVQKLLDRPQALPHFANRRTAARAEKYIIRKEFANLVRPNTAVRRGLNQPSAFETTTLQQLKAFLLETNPGVEVLKKQ